MNHQFIYTSLTRISDLAEIEFDVEKLDREHWETGDYVVSKILDPGGNTLKLELTNGRMRGVIGGESIVGALGNVLRLLRPPGPGGKLKPTLKCMF